MWGAGLHSTEDSTLTSHPEDLSLNPSITICFLGNFEVAEVNQRHCNVDKSHLELDSGKQVLPKLLRVLYDNLSLALA